MNRLPWGGSLKNHLAVLSALVLAGCLCIPVYAQDRDDTASVPGPSASSGDEALVTVSNPRGSALPVDETSLRLDDEGASDPLVQDREGGSSAWALVRAILVLAVLAFLVWLLLHFIRRRAARQAGASPHLKVLASTSVALNRHVHVVGLGSKAWLVGSSESAVNLIAEIDDQELIDQLRLEDSRRSALESTVAGNFSRLFSSLTGRGRKPEPVRGHPNPRAPGGADRSSSAPGEEVGQGGEALRRARERLSDL